MAKIYIENAEPAHPDFKFAAPISLTVEEGNNLAIIGANGSGKSQFVDLLTGKLQCKYGGKVELTEGDKVVHKDQIKYISFRDVYTMSDNKPTYYQQRWNATENEESPLVTELIGEERCRANMDLVRSLAIEDILEKRLIFLSSGELRKMQIFKSILSKPRILAIDNPYIGLDAESRDFINQLLRDLSEKEGIQIILVLSNPADVPDIIDVVLPMEKMACLPVMKKDEFLADTRLHERLFPTLPTPALPSDGVSIEPNPYDVAIVMNNVHVTYFTKRILREVDWKVMSGDKWALLGRNGCGKSTLLSLVCGDNPQAYANDITLFDRKRGSGESIWEIKEHIGYLSPDVHTYYRSDISCIDVVASGFFDTIGLYKKPNDEQRRLALGWMKAFAIDHLANKFFLQVSYGEQRAVLLTRVFVKMPSLLILDEPLHGLDVGKKRLAKAIIEKYCSSKEVTLIYVTHYRHEIPACVTQEKVLKKIQ